MDWSARTHETDSCLSPWVRDLKLPIGLQVFEGKFCKNMVRVVTEGKKLGFGKSVIHYKLSSEVVNWIS